MEIKKPKVSILMITYNHEAYIKEAITSVMSQKTNFDYELIIGEDCSTDKTREIVEEYSKKYPEVIKVICGSYNVGAQENFKRISNMARGDYIALIEGDDYWIDEFKLEKQINFMDEHTDVYAIAHRAKIILDKSATEFQKMQWQEDVAPLRIEGYINLKSLLKFNILIPTASLVIRRKVLDELPLWLENIPMGDLYIQIKSRLLGNLYLIPDVMSAYRITSNGTMATTNYEKIKIGIIYLLENFLKQELTDFQKKELLISYDNCCRDLLDMYTERNLFLDANQIIKKQITIKLKLKKIPFKELKQLILLRIRS